MEFNRLREKEAHFYFESENVKEKFTLDRVFKSIRFRKIFTPKWIFFCVLCLMTIRKN